MSMIDALYALFGAPQQPDTPPVKPRTDFPSEDEAREAIKNDATYGYDAAPSMGPGGRFRQLPNTREAARVLNSDRPNFGPPNHTLNDDERVKMMQAFLGAQRSPLAALGFDPTKMVSTVPKSGPELNVAGMYMPERDTIWHDGETGSTPVHESMHRGREMLQKYGSTPGGVRDSSIAQSDGATGGNAAAINGPKHDEMVVRALIARYFGDVEHIEGADAGNRQVRQGKNFGALNQGLLDQIEQAAADMVKKRGRPMGPR
jgi:hypothetical protein